MIKFTFFYRRKKTLLFNTLHVRNAMLPSGKRKPSFKMVSNMVMQLLHSIKYSVEVPFSNIAQQPTEIQKLNSTKKVGDKIFIIINKNTFRRWA